MGLSLISLTSLSFKSLLGNPLRSGLSVVGVFMGVAAVSATLQVGKISQAVITKQLSERDAPTLIVRSGRWQPGVPYRPLNLEDLEYLQRRLKTVEAISATSWRLWWVDGVIFQDQVVNPQDSMAVTQEYLQTSGRSILAGRFFNSTDFEQYRPVIVLDQILATELFGSQNPIDQKVYMINRPFIVVGVIESKIQSADADKEGLLLIPITTNATIIGVQNIHRIFIRIGDLDRIDQLEEAVVQLLEKRAPGQEFRIETNVQDIVEQKQTLESVSKALLVVGAIALLVGGVGIANITIASVIERTPEIGLRRAIGATQFDVMLQFILEAAILSLFGGAIAVITVHGVTVVVAKQFELPYEFDSKTTLMALGSAVLVGVGAGFLPAMRASQLDPVKALRGD
ncbi:MAG: ABC transporter permease [Oscillatoriales cyanobacterium RM2_1_1]|nr:ABC transporter permease [Oscillatoriales cyanobacterium SM2_3_0]NJO45070.1 ABC transporter permease [Oscillatoriales cyanobacterium RM2_1_1]